MGPKSNAAMFWASSSTSTSEHGVTRVEVWLRHPEFEGREFLEPEDFEQIAVEIVEEEVRLDAATCPG